MELRSLRYTAYRILCRIHSYGLYSRGWISKELGMGVYCASLIRSIPAFAPVHLHQSIDFSQRKRISGPLVLQSNL